MIDISEQCGYTIEQQCSLFESIRPLFANKQLILVINKIDQQPWETLESEHRERIEKLTENVPNCTLMCMSNTSEEGVSEVKAMACDKLLAARVDSRIAASAGKKVENVMNRLQVIYPTARDSIEREAFIPDSVKKEMQEDGVANKDGKLIRSFTGYAETKESKAANENDGDEDLEGNNTKKTARDLMWENGGPGVWAPDYREQYDLADVEWKFDAIPQIMDGKNIADYIDPAIDKKLAQLEAEEDQIMKELEAQAMGEDEESDLDSEEEAVVAAIRQKKNLARLMSKTTRGQNRGVMPRKIRGKAKDKHDQGVLHEDAIKKKMDSYGVDASKMIERGRKREREVDAGRRRRRREPMEDEEMMSDVEEATDENGEPLSKSQIKRRKRERAESKKRDESVARSHSRPRAPTERGLKDDAMAKFAKKKDRQARKLWAGAGGEGDRYQSVHLVKWCNTGKKRNSTHYQR